MNEHIRATLSAPAALTTLVLVGILVVVVCATVP